MGGSFCEGRLFYYGGKFFFDGMDLSFLAGKSVGNRV